jgi:hypothetical protein
MASKFLKPQLALAKRQMASMAVKKVDGPAKIHQVEVSWTWKINSSCAFDRSNVLEEIRNKEILLHDRKFSDGCKRNKRKGRNI